MLNPYKPITVFHTKSAEKGCGYSFICTVIIWIKVHSGKITTKTVKGSLKLLLFFFSRLLIYNCILFILSAERLCTLAEAAWKEETAFNLLSFKLKQQYLDDSVFRFAFWKWLPIDVTRMLWKVLSWKESILVFILPSSGDDTASHTFTFIYLVTHFIKKKSYICY